MIRKLLFTLTIFAFYSLCFGKVDTFSISKINITKALNTSNYLHYYRITIFFQSPFPDSTVLKDVNSYEFIKINKPEVVIKPNQITDISKTDSTVSVNLDCYLYRNTKYKLKFNGSYFNGKVTTNKGLIDTLLNDTGTIEISADGIDGPSDFQFAINALNGIGKDYSATFKINDQWNDYLPYYLDGILTTTPDSFQNNLNFTQQLRINLIQNFYSPLLIEAKVASDQRFDTAEITAGAGFSFYVPYSNKIPLIKQLSCRQVPLRKARCFLGFDGGGKYGKDIDSNGVFRFKGELAWRIQLINTSSYITILAKAWALNPFQKDNYSFKKYADINFEYAFTNMVGGKISYQAGSLPPNFNYSKTVEIGVTVSPELKNIVNK
jgi:hypothetical protein